MAAAVVRRVPARVGLVGNPSDGFGGAVLGTVVPALAATVSARPADAVIVTGPGFEERWPSLDALTHDGPQRIVTAALVCVAQHVGGRPVAVTWATEIPRSVGLAGSSALAVATIDAAAASWGVQLDRRVTAALALSAERDVLGIAAGWQDRIIQSFACTTLVDAGAMEVVDGLEVPSVDVIDARLRLVVGWATQDATSSDDYHAPLRRSAAALTAPMAELAALARRAAADLRGGDIDAVAVAVEEGWRVRQSAAPLRDEHAALVEWVRRHGVPCTTPGSGGAVVALCRSADDERRAVAALTARGCEHVTARVGRIPGP